jgi:hypothetical protein
VLLEVRHYQVKPGRRDDWVRYMEDVIIPYQESKGAVVHGSFIDDEDENRYVWLRSFADEEQRKEIYDAMYTSDEWTNTISPPIGDMLDRGKNVIERLYSTPKSKLQ